MKKIIAELCSASMCLSLASFVPTFQCNAGDVMDAPAAAANDVQETEKVIKDVYVEFESVPQFYYNTETSFDSKQIKKAILHIVYNEQTKDSENPEVINEYEETTDITKDVRLVDAKPKMMFDKRKEDVVYEIPVIYDGDSIPSLAKKEFIKDIDHNVINIKAYIGLKGDTNLDNRIDAIDASQILNYYTQSGADNNGKSAMILNDNTDKKDKNYEEFSAFFH